ncbi:DNA pilot protein [Tortoise microvirus 16]|nr:DNA pilot protein [Tortoise microvirus 16]QCS37045.1 DNA pilot protein [Tortoise microvirus 45]
MDPLTLMMLSSGVGALVDLYGIHANREMQADANALSSAQFQQSLSFNQQQARRDQANIDRSYAFAVDEQQYQRNLTQTQFERQDTAYQRAAADAKAAGFSPLAIFGGSGAQSTVSSPSMSAPTGSGSPGAPGLPHLMANPLDYSGFANIAMSAANTYLKSEELGIQKERLLDDQQRWRQELTTKVSMQTQQIEASMQELVKSIESQQTIATGQQETQRDISAGEISQKDRQLAETIRNNTNLVIESANNRTSSDNKVVRQMLSEAGFYNQRPLEPQAYAIAMPQWLRNYDAFLRRMESSGILIKTSDASSSSHSESLSLKGGGISAGGISLSGSRSGYQATSRDALELYRAEEKRFNAMNPFPILLKGYEDGRY